jgi:hypothetical protein
MEDKQIKIGMQLRESYHRKLKQMALDRSLSLYEIVDEVLQKGLGMPSSEMELNKDERKWVDMLLRILRSGDRGAIAAVQPNLIQFYRVISLQKQVAQKKISA